MGALHEGHARLIDQARRHAGENGRVIASIFVNPTQFAPGEDFSRYPRAFEADAVLCARHGADAVFAPADGEMYAPDASVMVDETALSAGLCGAARPGHFRGVCTIVAKLFHLVQPHAAVFGEKDYQQLAVIRRMVRDLDFPVEILGHPTVRESDGLAMSSRNRYLTPDERRRAPGIHRELRAVQERARHGDLTAPLLADLRGRLESATGGRVDYVALVDAETLAPLERLDRPARLAVAVFLGRARLIDNVPVEPAQSGV